MREHSADDDTDFVLKQTVLAYIGLTLVGFANALSFDRALASGDCALRPSVNPLGRKLGLQRCLRPGDRGQFPAYIEEQPVRFAGEPVSTPDGGIHPPRIDYRHRHPVNSLDHGLTHGAVDHPKGEGASTEN